MFKLDYYSQNARWPDNFRFSSWSEYWKTLAYLSNPSIHKYYKTGGYIFANQYFDINIKYEYNSRTNSYSDTGRLSYYGYSHNEAWFARNFSDIYTIKSGTPGGNTIFRINRKEFMETLEYDLRFIRIREPEARDDIMIPEEGNVALHYALENPNFDIDSWNLGWELGNI